MRYSDLLIPTVKEVPAEAEIASHQLMIRAGFIRKLSSGAYTYLPLGWRVLQKIMAIVRQEMNAAGAQEICMPILQPMELWQKTGRDKDYGPTMFQFNDRHGRPNALAPTAEEVVTSLVSGEINSYKQLPINLYQINTKFRDEFRPRFGVLRSREFIMKDAYSFHASIASLDETYQKMYDAYCRIFKRCGLKYAPVEAESGPIGGSASHEFMVPCNAGEDVIVHTEDFTYAANIEKAEVDAVRTTGVPPVGPANATGGTPVPPIEEVHTPDVGTIEAVCSFLGARPTDMIKTLVFWEPIPKLLVKFDAALADPAADPVATAAIVKRLFANVYVALVRGDHEMNPAKLSHQAGGKTLELAPEQIIKAITGAKVGFAGPMGLAAKVGKLFIDHVVAAMPVGVTGANKSDYHMKNVVPGRDFPLTGENVVVADIRNAAQGDTYRGKKLCFSRGIEIGHVFKLGTKYSEKLEARFLDEKGVKNACIMGCYGIGINRIFASAIETDAGHDANGPILPVSIAPFEVSIVSLNADKPEVVSAAQSLYKQLQDAGVEVLLDDRDARPGVKFKDADLIGVPLRVVVGEKNLKDGNLEIKRRTDEKATLVPAGEAFAQTTAILKEMKTVLE
jgi:prolyl-tRNA synthetase